MEAKDLSSAKTCVKLVAIAKNEGPYIPQWVYHHFSAGVDLIEIHINNTSDNSLSICKKIAKKEKRFTCLNGDSLLKRCQGLGKNYQIAAYNESFKKSLQGLDSATHILFLDLDEYLISKIKRDNISYLVNSQEGVGVFLFFSTWNTGMAKKSLFLIPL